VFAKLASRLGIPERRAGFCAGYVSGILAESTDACVPPVSAREAVRIKSVSGEPQGGRALPGTFTPAPGEEAALMSVRTAYWMAIMVFVLIASAVWFGWVAGLLR
jgi:hypothetical protein